MVLKGAGALFAAALLAGCNSSTTPTAATTTVATSTAPTVTSIAVAGEPVLTGLRQRSQVTASATLSDTSTVNIVNLGTWRSSDPGVASVSNGGVVTTIAAGTTRVTVTYLNGSDGLDVTVAPVTTTFQGTVTTSDGRRGTFTLVMQGAVTTTATPTTEPLSGSIQLGNSASYEVAGLFEAATGVVTLSASGAALNFLAGISNGALTGSFTDPSGVTGSLASTRVTVGS